MLRLAIGIQSSGFGLTEDDYYALFEFDPVNQYEIPQAYDAFKNSCDQIKAKYPTMNVFKKVYKRYDESY